MINYLNTVTGDTFYFQYFFVQYRAIGEIKWKKSAAEQATDNKNGSCAWNAVYLRLKTHTQNT